MQSKGRFIKVIIVLLLLVFVSVGCTKGGSSDAKNAYKRVTIVWWGVWDDSDDLKDITLAYRQAHPNVRISYKKFRYEEYERELLEALAEDRGPDVFMVHNTWMKRYQSKLMPSPAAVKIPVKKIVGSIKKEEVVEFVTKRMLTPNEIKAKFVDVVADDVILIHNSGTTKTPKYSNKGFGLPMSVDTLAMYFNKDILNNAGIIQPAENWADFQEQVKRITKINQETEEVLLSGAAIGTASNVLRSFDLVSLLMMQNLAPMLDSKGKAAFNLLPASMPDLQIPPAVGAVEYYTQFASPLYEGYTWNDDMPNSLDAFAKGKTAYFFGYSYHRPDLELQAPKLNYGITTIPQVGSDQKVNYASYWVNVVSEKAKQKSYAWDLIHFVADEANVEKYLARTSKPTALRSTTIINKQLKSPSLAPFAEQLLTAKSWYKGYSPTAAENVFKEMIDLVLSGEIDTYQAIQQAVDKINVTIRQKL
jgi:multiple sugar transport system substrate-binding protein